MKRLRAAAMSLVLAAAFTSAQDTKDRQQTEEPEAPKIPRALVILGYSDWGLKGNEHKMRQYATPPRGLTIRELAFESGFFDGKSWLRLSTPGQADYAFDGKAVFMGGKFSLDGSGGRTTFFNPTPIVIPRSERRVEEVNGRYDLGQGATLTGSYRKEKRDQYFEPTRDARHDLNYYWNGGLDANIAGGFAALGYTERQYFDRTNFRPDTRIRQWRGSYERQLFPGFDIAGAFSQSNIFQQGNPNATVENWSLGGNWSIGDTTELGLRTSREETELPQASNAWVRTRLNTSANLYHSFGNWRLQGGYTRREYERVRADQMFVDVSRWDIYEAKLAGRLTDSSRLTMKLRQQSLREGATMQTADPRALYFDDRTTGQVKVDCGNDRLSGYGVYSFSFLENEPRDVMIRNFATSGGATYQVRDGLELFGEVNLERSNVRSEIVDPFELKTFFPKSKTLALGVNWAARSDTFFSATLTELTTDNDNPLNLPDGNIHGKTFTTSVRHRTASGNEYTVLVAPFRYDDKMLNQMGYRTTFLQVTASFRF